MSFREEYNPTVLDHFLNPRNAGEVSQPDGVGVVKNPACGDMIRLSLKITNGRIEAARARTFGCAAAIASSSVLTGMLQGRSLEEAERIRNSDIVTALQGLPPYKIVCSLVAEEAVRAALVDYRGRAKDRG